LAAAEDFSGTRAECLEYLYAKRRCLPERQGFLLMDAQVCLMFQDVSFGQDSTDSLSQKNLIEEEEENEGNK